MSRRATPQPHPPQQGLLIDPDPEPEPAPDLAPDSAVSRRALAADYSEYLLCDRLDRVGRPDPERSAQVVSRIHEAHATIPPEDCNAAWAEARLRWRLLHGVDPVDAESEYNEREEN